MQSLNTTYTNSNEVDNNNNAHKQQGSFTTTNGTTNKMDDVWFDVDLAKTKKINLVKTNLIETKQLSLVQLLKVA